MSDKANNVEAQQTLGRLIREGSQDMQEVSVVTSSGARAVGWAAKVKSLASYNFYNVCAVDIESAGTLPMEIDGQMEAVNLAEPFLQTGQLPEGTYVAMFKVGKKYVFYAPV